MSVFEDSTINGWIHKPGPINLRHTTPKRDDPQGKGIVIGALLGLNFWIWSFVIFLLLR